MSKRIILILFAIANSIGLLLLIPYNIQLNIPFANYLNGTMILAFIIAIFLSKKELLLASRLVMFVCYFGLAVASCFFDGIYSTSLFYTSILGIICCFFFSLKEGLIWSAIGFLSNFMFSLYISNVVEGVYRLSQAQNLTFLGSTIFSASLGGILVSFAFSYSRSQIIKTLSDEKLTINKMLREKQILLDTVCHDINNPLAVFNTLKYIMAKKRAKFNLNEITELEYRNHLENAIERCFRNSHYIQDICNSALILQFIDSGMIDPLFKETELKEIQETLEEIFLDKYTKKNVLLKFQNFEGRIQTDKTILTHNLLGNLISNALKFSNQGQSVLVNYEKTQLFNEISVIDEGVGIPNEKIEKIFTHSKCKSSMGTNGERGTGLGLSVVLHLTELCSGKLTIQSPVVAESKGTKITLHFPLATNIMS